MEIPLEALVVAAGGVGGSILAVATKLATAFHAYVERKDREIGDLSKEVSKAREETSKTVERIMNDQHARIERLMDEAGKQRETVGDLVAEVHNLAEMLGQSGHGGIS